MVSLHSNDLDSTTALCYDDLQCSAFIPFNLHKTHDCQMNLETSLDTKQCIVSEYGAAALGLPSGVGVFENSQAVISLQFWMT